METKFVLHQDTSITLIRSYSEGVLLIGDTQYNESVIVTSQGCQRWPLTSLESLSSDHFKPLFELDFKPEVVLLGTGRQMQFPKPAQTQNLLNAQIGFEVMATDAACRTYNVLADDGRKVVACLLL